MHVKFNVSNENTKDPLLANDIFVHYFAESELEEYNKNNNVGNQSGTLSGQGLSRRCS